MARAYGRAVEHGNPWRTQGGAARADPSLAEESSQPGPPRVQGRLHCGARGGGVCRLCWLRMEGVPVAGLTASQLTRSCVACCMPWHPLARQSAWMRSILQLSPLQCAGLAMLPSTPASLAPPSSPA